MKSIHEYICYLTEVNRIIQGLVKRSGKPADHISNIWKDTEKELVSKHQFGITDRYRAIGNIVRDKLGVKPDPEDEKETDDDTSKE